MAIRILLADDHKIVRQGLRKEIGSILGISVKTVESHRANIMQKLNIREVAGLVRYAIRQGLIMPD
ncbi:MAG TPA: LuxR C-terminal-related transcriptional regulator [Terriglobales bacterium]|nr:LuxR C-terminal-related transcriptional regulator [Terriglobales bacterium]